MALKPDIYINLATAICCFVFLLFLFISYFIRKNMDNLENKIYRYMLIVNMTMIVTYSLFYLFDIVAVLTNHIDEIYPFIYFLSKLGPMFIILWLFLLDVYLFIICYEKKITFLDWVKKNEKKIIKFVCIAWLLILLISFFERSDVDLSTGMEYNLLFTMNFFLILFYIILFYLILKNGRHLPSKKVLPVYAILPISIFSFVCGALGIKITLIYIIDTVIDHLMYHTIENPDMKLIAELQLAKNAAEKANNAKSEFLSSMSHELRTPLNAIVGLSSMIKDTSNDLDSRNDAADIYKASNNLLELVDGILDINKLEANEMEVVEKNYRVFDLLDNVIKSAKIRLGSKPIELKTDYSKDIPTVLYGDSDKIRMILNNILSNAVKYTESGTIKLSVVAFIIKDKCNLTFSISDTGRGIPEDQIPYLFTKFYRLNEDRDSNIEGTGLGLAITKSLVELLDGKITVDSVYGEGTTFVVNISQKIFLDENVELL